MQWNFVWNKRAELILYEWHGWGTTLLYQESVKKSARGILYRETSHIKKVSAD